MESNKKIESPCIKLCKVDCSGTKCISCFRSVNEISNWSMLSEESKRIIVNDLERRKQSYLKGCG